MGGMIVEGIPGKLKRNRPNVYEDLVERAHAIREESRFVEYCVRTAGSLAARDSELAVRTKLPLGRVQHILQGLAQQQRIIALAPKLYMHKETSAETARRVLDLVGNYHRQSPESPGISLDQLRLAAGQVAFLADVVGERESAILGEAGVGDRRHEGVVPRGPPRERVHGLTKHTPK